MSKLTDEQLRPEIEPLDLDLSDGPTRMLAAALYWKRKYEEEKKRPFALNDELRAHILVLSEENERLMKSLSACFDRGCNGCEECIDAVEQATPPSAPVAQEPVARIDVCTDPTNCKRCKAPAWDKEKHSHAGISDFGRAVLTVQETIHASDCAMHNEPAYPNGPCDCGALPQPFALAWFYPNGKPYTLTWAGEDAKRVQGGGIKFYSTPLYAGSAPIAPTGVAGWKLVPEQPTEPMWGELARDLVWFLYSHGAPHYGSKLHRFLENLGREIPAWLAKEIPKVDHSPAKGTFAACIYKAMLAAAPTAPAAGDTSPLGHSVAPSIQAGAVSQGFGWLPAETRPVTGTYLVANARGQVAPWINGVIHNNTGADAGDWQYGEAVTHWVQLPPAPEQE